MSNRIKTRYRHVDAQGNVHMVKRVKNTQDYYIAGTDESAEGKMMHEDKVEHHLRFLRGEVKKRKSSGGTYGNPFRGTGSGEWDHYAHSADDL